jgi:hypothetical protein
MEWWKTGMVEDWSDAALEFCGIGRKTSITE